ncbi:MAG: lactate utilization protein [Pseudomonadota bacterium]
MSGARDEILSRIRRAEWATADSEGRRRAEVEQRLAARAQTAPIPGIARLEGAARVERFVEQLQAVQGAVTRLPDLAALPEALSNELRQRNLPQAIRKGADPDFAGLDWGALETSDGPGRIEEPATLTRAFSAAAETGTLMLTSGPDNPVTLTFLGETHFVVLRASEIEAGLEGAWARLRAAGLDPRTVNLVTGPSRTADIEQTLELGAHGPVALHLFLIEDA